MNLPRGTVTVPIYTRLLGQEIQLGTLEIPITLKVNELDQANTCCGGVGSGCHCD